MTETSNRGCTKCIDSVGRGVAGNRVVGWVVTSPKVEQMAFFSCDQDSQKKILVEDSRLARCFRRITVTCIDCI